MSRSSGSEEASDQGAGPVQNAGPVQGSVDDRYVESLDFLYERVNYEKQNNRPYSANHFKLDRMRSLLKLLGDPHLTTPTIHIAGTKGKGSTATMIASMCSACGWRTGLYTSPHLLRLEERFTVDGVPCSPSQLIELVDQLKIATERLYEQIEERPTFFELTTALAWLHFARAKVDLIVLEVGLGGRLDSTNVCQPIMTVITSISLDHQAQLGETLEEIATEKAGIIKRSIPVVCGVGAGIASLSTDSAGQVAAQRKIHQIAANLESPVRQLGRDFHVQWNKRFHRNPTAKDEVVEGTVLGGSIRYRSGAAPLDTAVNDSPIDGSLGSEWDLSMPGRHQADNAALAIATLQWMKELGWNFDEEKMRVGLCSARAKARIEVVSSDPWRIIDTAHNIASIDALLETLKEYFPEQRRIMIFAASRDKDFKQMLRAIRSHCDLLILTQYRENPRAVPLDLLQTSFVEVMREAPSTSTQPWDMPKPLMLSARDPEEAWEIGLQLSGPDDLLCATGSFFLAAELFPVIGSKRFAPSTEKKSSPPLSD